jgi:hypothetical protein
MIRRTETSEATNERTALLEALRSGVTAMADPEIEKRVVDYFTKNPSYSRDAIHVAAVACRIRAELAGAGKARVPIPAQKSVSHSP